MKYAVVNQRNGINRVTDTEPQNLLDSVTSVQITDEQATTIQEGRLNGIRYFLIDGELVDGPTHRKNVTYSDMSVEELKVAKVKEITEARDAMWKAVLTTSFEVPFYTDIQTQLDISFMIQMLADGETFSGYKCADKVHRDITKEQFSLALQEGVNRKVQAYGMEAIKLAEIEAASTVEELLAINW